MSGLLALPIGIVSNRKAESPFLHRKNCSFLTIMKGLLHSVQHFACRKSQHPWSLHVKSFWSLTCIATWNTALNFCFVEIHLQLEKMGRNFETSSMYINSFLNFFSQGHPGKRKTPRDDFWKLPPAQFLHYNCGGTCGRLENFFSRSLWMFLSWSTFAITVPTARMLSCFLCWFAALSFGEWTVVCNAVLGLVRWFCISIVYNCGGPLQNFLLVFMNVHQRKVDKRCDFAVDERW